MRLRTLTWILRVVRDCVATTDAARDAGIDDRTLFCSARRRRANTTNSTSTRIITPTTMPTTMPIKAPFTEELEPLLDVLVGVVYLKHAVAWMVAGAWAVDAPGYGVRYDVDTLEQYSSPA